MVKLKFIVKDGSLVLRISEGKDRYYKSVKHLLTGSPNLERHWNADKERFTCNASSYSENNKALEEFKSTYPKLLLEHPELTARQVASYFQPIKQVGIISPQKATDEWRTLLHHRGGVSNVENHQTHLATILWRRRYSVCCPAGQDALQRVRPACRIGEKLCSPIRPPQRRGLPSGLRQTITDLYTASKRELARVLVFVLSVIWLCPNTLYL